MRKLQALVRSLSLLLLLAGSSGCALLVVGAGAAGAVMYVNGELKSSEATGIDRAWSATQSTMKDLEFNVVKTQKDAVSALLEARRADDTRIVVRLQRQSDTVTEIRIRVGTMGDESLSRLILDKIKVHCQ